jgi:hypothetical protein
MNTFYQAWSNWYQAASDPNSNKEQVKNLTNDLISFLKEHEQQFMFATKNTPEPLGPQFTESFSNLYTNTLSDLESWKSRGCKSGQASMLSELVNDVYTWCLKAYS